MPRSRCVWLPTAPGGGHPPGSDGPEEVLAAIRTGGHQCSEVEADNTDPAAVRAAIQQIAESHGRLDILVNNAGVIRIAPIDEMDIADFDLHFTVNVRGAFVASQEAARHMRSGGRIIMIGSCTADRMPFVGGSAYAMSKAAIAGMARCIARDPAAAASQSTPLARPLTPL